ncbi:hypothetical protein [Thalassomonas sp. M1454]|uniref:hypothetical protein n=1 Tax=Thalassomonas sp. M1454 TaxID=2594477 RepID=UPI001180FC07|nr:hypothetical protein [Thalassomonas sp. M1454]TRX55822.1 hypothetical protein FNN08_09380 [Thalassomonas sp. M1454]
MAHDLLSHSSMQSTQFSELCNAMYEREVMLLANANFSDVKQIQNRLKSLSHYIKRTATSMLALESPLLLDLQNASWTMKQAKQLPIAEQATIEVQNWYMKNPPVLGLIVPVLVKNGATSRIIIDCVDRVDIDNSRFRTNYCGWFNYQQDSMNDDKSIILLKPNKKVLTAACSGHQWQGNNKTQPITLSLRELLLSCQINWRNLRAPIPLNVSVF